MNYKMAEQIREVAGDSITSTRVMEQARLILAGLSEGIEAKEFENLLFEYSFTLMAEVATNVSVVCLGQDNFDKMSDSLMAHEVDTFLESIQKEGK